jgi:hypothetical protein
MAAHTLFFTVIARYFPIFEHHSEDANNAIPDGFRSTYEQVVSEKI